MTGRMLLVLLVPLGMLAAGSATAAAHGDPMMAAFATVGAACGGGLLGWLYGHEAGFAAARKLWRL